MMPKPLAIDLFCGLGGWTEGLLAEDYRVIGFDTVRHVYGEAQYPGELVLQDVLTLHGSQFKDAALIVASPPCQAYSYRAMPWKKAKALPPPDNSLFEACFRIQREASAAAGQYVPLVVENVCGAQKWVGRACWHYGSFYLWGDVPALMPIAMKRRMKFPADCGPRMWRDREFVRLDDGNASAFHHERQTKADGIKAGDRNKARGSGGHKWDTGFDKTIADGIKRGGDWFNDSQPSISRLCGSKSSARKAASAHIAKIPFPLAAYIGRAWYPA